MEISLKDALAINSAYELGDKIKFEEAPAEFGRVAAQSAKQTIMEKMRKQTRAITYNTYKEHEQEIMSGTVERFDNRFIYVNLGSIEAQLSKQDQIPGEVLLLMIVSKFMFTRLKTTLVVWTSLLAVVIQKWSNV